MAYKVAANSELVNTGVPRENTRLEHCDPLVTFSSTDQYITLFFVCFCLKIPYIIYITLNSQPIAQLMPELNFSKTFSPKGT